MSIAIRPDLTVDTCHDLFNYDERSGLITWKRNPKRGRRVAGDAVGSVNAAGYRVVLYNGRWYPVHRIVWAMLYGYWPTLVDHADGNRENNRRANLREATPAQNAQNSGRKGNNASGKKGVSWSSKFRCWSVEIMANGLSYHIGMYNNVDAAASAYDAAAEELHGEFARTNRMIDRRGPPCAASPAPIVRMYDPLHGRSW